MDQLGNRLLKAGIITQEQLDAALERQKQHGGRLGENIIALGYLSASEVEHFFKRHPSPPLSVADTGLDLGLISELALKHALFLGDFRMVDIAERIKLPIPVVDRALEVLRRDKYVEIKGGTGYAATTYTFKVTEAGKSYGSELLDICRYVGPAPVTIDDYEEMVELQTIKSIVVEEESVKKAFSHLVMKEDILRKIGPAMSAGRAVFLYGPPGNGKTTIAETVGRLLSDNIYLPYAITVGGQIITVFDPVNHMPVDHGAPPQDIDRRWVHVRRPVVITGGELVMRMLDLDFNPIAKYYEASLQLKANNGLFIIDDFGRQLIEPHQLLNRWIVPLDRGIDFMTLHTGMKFSIPFNMLVIFATNIEPAKLVDEAFLRRIPYKIKIDRPTVAQFTDIFKRVCASNDLTFDRAAFDYLLQEYYGKTEINFNACHPRDIIDHIVVNSRYYHHKPELTKESIDAAWSSYFVE
jgi:energy-coupling factor transporter ATP-binding protein EcfA2